MCNGFDLSSIFRSFFQDYFHLPLFFDHFQFLFLNASIFRLLSINNTFLRKFLFCVIQKCVIYNIYLLLMCYLSVLLKWNFFFFSFKHLIHSDWLFFDSSQLFLFSFPIGISKRGCIWKNWWFGFYKTSYSFINYCVIIVVWWSCIEWHRRSKYTWVPIYFLYSQENVCYSEEFDLVGIETFYWCIHY